MDWMTEKSLFDSRLEQQFFVSSEAFRQVLRPILFPTHLLPIRGRFLWE